MDALYHFYPDLYSSIKKQFITSYIYTVGINKN